MEPRRAHLLELSVRRGCPGGTEAAATLAQGPRPTVTVRGAGAARRREPCGAQCGPCAHRPRFLVRRRNPPRSRHRGCADAGELVLDPEAPQARMPDTRALPPRAAWSPTPSQGGGLTFSREEESGKAPRVTGFPGSTASGHLPAGQAGQRLPRRRGQPVPSAPRPCGQSLSPCEHRGADSPTRDKETHQNDASQSASPIQATRTRNQSRTPLAEAGL